ncbi:hypothetical protein [Nocardia sp. NPDC050710]|uniref:hypothetical protein n=1 Tax=Nocardia sp. NPDC050710 TaxID=3157220 RepID=UPI0033D338F3
MTDPFHAFDAELARIFAACRDEDHPLTDAESRILAAAFAQQGTPLEHWGEGIDVAHTHRLVDDAQWLLDAASIVRAKTDPHRYNDDAPNALYSLVAYFQGRALNPPSREDYQRELFQIYAPEVEFLRACGHEPYIGFTGQGDGCTGVVADLDVNHELYATNGDTCVVGSATEERPGPWSVGIYERDGHCVTNAVDPCFANAYIDAVETINRPRFRRPRLLLRRIARIPRLNRK